MAQTKAQRRAAGKMAAQTRASNQLNKQVEENPHDVERPEEARTPMQDGLGAYGIDRDSVSGAAWEKPSELDAPPPREGYTQRWIRIRLGASEDSKNSLRKFREGWLPRALETVPSGYVPPTIQHAQLGGIIGVDDLILCEMPIKKAKQRNAYYEARKNRMIESVENDLRKVDRSGPRIDMKNKTQVTKRRLRVPEDPAE